MIEFKTNFADIARKWKEKPKKFEAAMNKGLQEGLRQYERKFIKDQLSGRRNKNYGLKKQSGILSSLVNVTMSKDGTDVVGKLAIGENAWYAKLHQHYKFNGYGY